MTSVFGLSFGEVVLLVIIGIVVIGPRNLPSMMRTIGRTVTKVKRVTTDLREQSGIDEILRAEGIEKEVAELRKLATGRIMDVNLDDEPELFITPPRSREFPQGGVDTYGAVSEEDLPYTPPKLAPPEGDRVERGRPTPAFAPVDLGAGPAKTWSEVLKSR